jgi:hypothetical protein
MIIAMATAASAAAIAMINRVKYNPSIFPGQRYSLNAMKLIFTLFKISSTDIRMVTRFLRERNPKIPMKNNAVLNSRK